MSKTESEPECAFCDKSATHVNELVGYYVCDKHALMIDVDPISR